MHLRVKSIQTRTIYQLDARLSRAELEAVRKVVLVKALINLFDQCGHGVQVYLGGQDVKFPPFFGQVASVVSLK